MGAAMRKASALEDKVYGPGGGNERWKSGEISYSQLQDEYLTPWQDAEEAEGEATRSWRACRSS